MTNQGKKEKMGKKVGRSSPTTIVRGGANPGTSRSRLSARPKTEKARKEASVDFASLSICFLWWRRVISPHPSATPPSQSQPGPPLRPGSSFPLQGPASIHSSEVTAMARTKPHPEETARGAEAETAPVPTVTAELIERARRTGTTGRMVMVVQP